MPTVVTTDTILPAGQTATFTNAYSGYILRPVHGQPSPSLTIAGSVIVTHTANGIIAGIDYSLGALYTETLVTITATGSLSVTANGEAATGVGLFGQSWTGDVANHGTLTVFGTLQAFGIMSADRTFGLTHTGVTRVSSHNEAYGVRAANGGILNNTGLVEATGAKAWAFFIDHNVTLTNSGTIRAVSTGAIESIGIQVSHGSNETSRIVNTGLIEADIAILDASSSYSPPPDSRQDIENGAGGRIVGRVDLAAGDDRLVNAGVIEGLVLMGGGADTYDGRGGRQTGGVHGGFGGDVLTGGDGADVLFGEDGDDIIDGGAGDDYLQGGRGDDRISGGDGVDTLTYAGLTRGVVIDLSQGGGEAAGRQTLSSIENLLGSRWGDRLTGDGLDNLLYGADGDDILIGGAGSDELAGGRGADTLTGGTGADVFRFGSGSGADIITDLSAEDRVVIHGYSAWRDVLQIGNDTLIVFSDTDSLLLRDTLISTLTPGRLQFSAQPMPDYQRTDVAPPAGLGDERFVFHDRVSILEGETVVWSHAGGLNVFAADAARNVGVDNAGWLFVTMGPNDVAGVMLAGFGGRADFVNAAPGRLVVNSTGPSQVARGVISLDSGTAVTNHGLIEVTGALDAQGITNDQYSISVVNTGALRVVAGDNAYGVFLGHFGNLTNGGLIDVTGAAGRVFGVYGVTNTTVANSGQITVRNGDGVGVGIAAAMGPYAISNSGTITADRAIDTSRAYGGELTNSGRLAGAVLLSEDADLFINTGQVDGPVNLGRGDDIFDGRTGVQLARVSGGDGWDRLVGSSGSDDLAGDEGADTLTGGTGNDRLDGGAGDDIAVFSGARAEYSWTMSGGVMTVTGPDGVDTLTSVELLRFSDQLVSLTGYGLRMEGWGGDDVLHGTELNDVLSGGQVPPLNAANGRDSNGRDWLYGHEGNDILSGGGDIDFLDGGDGDDQLSGGGGADTLIGGDGRDLLDGGAGADQLDGGKGDDRIVGGDGDDVISGGDGDDVIEGGAGSNLIDGGYGFDQVFLAGEHSAYRLFNFGDVFYLKNEHGADHLISIELLRFASGRTVDLAALQQRLDHGQSINLGEFLDGGETDMDPHILPGEQPEVSRIWTDETAPHLKSGWLSGDVMLVRPDGQETGPDPWAI